MTQLKFPFQIDQRGHLAQTGQAGHLRDMIEQILFTIPGERVNRMDFGCGVSTMIFGPTTQEALGVKQTLIQGQLQKWLGHLIHVLEVQVSPQDSQVAIRIRYLVLSSQEISEQVFS